MQAITVKYLSPTNTRGARLKASCDRGSIAIPYPHELNRTEAHSAALRALVLKFKREDATRYGSTESNPRSGPWVEGTTKDGTTVFVNTLHAELTTTTTTMPLAYHTIRCPACRMELDVTSYDGTGSRRLPVQHCDCGRRVEMEDLNDIPLPTLDDLADDRTEPSID